MAYIFSTNEETLVLLFEGKLLVAVDGVVICCVLFGFIEGKDLSL